MAAVDEGMGPTTEPSGAHHDHSGTEPVPPATALITSQSGVSVSPSPGDAQD